MQQRQSAMQNTADKKRMEAQQTVSESTEIDLVELMYRLLEKWAIIILSCILGAVIACAYTLFMVTPQYTATSKLYVVNSNDSAINLSDLQIGPRTTWKSFPTGMYMKWCWSVWGWITAISSCPA